MVVVLGVVVFVVAVGGDVVLVVHDAGIVDDVVVDRGVPGRRETDDISGEAVVVVVDEA